VSITTFPNWHLLWLVVLSSFLQHSRLLIFFKLGMHDSVGTNIYFSISSQGSVSLAFLRICSFFVFYATTHMTTKVKKHG
jgi:hypothetical protein